MKWFQPKDGESKLPKIIKKTFSYAMICVYMVFGLFLLLHGWFTLSKTQSAGIGILLILYSTFRIYRMVRDTRQKDISDELIDTTENE